MSKALSGIFGSTAAATLAYLCMNLIGVHNPLIPAVLGIGALTGFLVGAVLAAEECRQTVSLRLSTIVGASVSVTLLGIGIIAIALVNHLSLEQLADSGLLGMLELVSCSAVGAAGALGYRLFVDCHWLRNFTAMALTSGFGSIIAAAVYGTIANDLALGDAMITHTLISSLGVGAVFGLIFAVVHWKAEPSPISSIATSAAFVVVALVVSIYSGLFLGFSAGAVIALVISALCLGTGAYLGSLLRT